MSSWVLLSSLGQPNTLLKNSYVSRAFLILFTVLLLLAIPSRDFHTYGGDMNNYVNFFQKIAGMSLVDTFKIAIWEPSFVFTQWIISRFTSNPSIYIIITVLIYILTLGKSIKNIFSPWQMMFILFAYLNFTFFYGYIFNGARQGFSIMLLLLAISIWLSKGRNLYFYIALILSASFHLSVIPATIILLSLKQFNFKIKTLLVYWAFFSLLFISGFNQFIMQIPFVNSITLIQSYASSAALEHYGGEVNNLKFYAFSAFFLILGLILYKTIKLESALKLTYLKIIKIYTALNCYFLLLGFVSFSDRIAIYSWFLIPILVLFPILNKEKHSPFLLFIVLLILALNGISSTQGFYDFGF
ncbi:EpsG family protein [Planococcus faecalis]|nr:EpsG family protein [Planococcus faecalis]